MIWKVSCRVVEMGVRKTKTIRAKTVPPKMVGAGVPPADGGTRQPSQERSRQRVEAILEATRALIIERGSAGLKIQDIAAQAGITAGSMYQYFPNKGAIIEALGHQYFASVEDTIKEGLKDKPSSRDELAEQFRVMFQAYFDLHVSDPVARDILHAIAADKSLDALDIEDTRKNARLIFARIKHLVHADEVAEVKRQLFLSLHMSRSVVLLVLDQPAKEQAALLDSAQRMMFVPFSTLGL